MGFVERENVILSGEENGDLGRIWGGRSMTKIHL